MPVGTDIITWDPRVGSTGDDRYDPGEDIRIEAGASDYSSRPTHTEINARSGINQILAEANRRIWPGNSQNRINANVSLFNYVSAGDRIDAADLTDLNTRINNVRDWENQSAFSFTRAVAAGDIIKRNDVLEWRKALASDYFTEFINGNDYSSWSSSAGQDTIRRNGASYPPGGPGSLLTSLRLGQLGDSSGFALYRFYMFFDFDSTFPTFASADLHLFITSVGAGHQSGNTMDIYRSNSDLAPLGTGDWGNLDNLENSTLITSLSAPSQYNTFALTNIPAAGNSWTLIAVTADEVNGNAPSQPLFGTDNETVITYNNINLPGVTFIRLFT